MALQPNIAPLRYFLYRLIQENGSEPTVQWITQQREKLTTHYADRTFHLAFGTAARFASKNTISLSEAQQQEIQKLRAGFQPEHWSVAQTVRAYLLLLLPHNDPAPYLSTLSRLLETASVDEQIAVYAALPLLPHPKLLVPLAINGLRTNITRVFDAVALHNPFPADYFPDEAWNQMVLKAIFMERPLYPIYALDSRANAPLARMLVDFAHERWAAGRPVTPELWRLVTPFLDASHRSDLERVIHSDQPWEQAAGVLACSQSKVPSLASLLKDLDGATESEGVIWDNIGYQYSLNKS